MSAGTASSTEPKTVYVRLLDEGSDAWRPVSARRLTDSVYQLSSGPIPEDEVWAFAPGEAVVVERRVSETDKEVMVAVARASDLDELSVAWLREAS